MAAKVTLQDIADELGLSRNTVSKAINNTGILADTTRDRVLLKAQEMGYKQFSYMRFKDGFTASSDTLGAAQEHAADTKKGGLIALLFTGLLGESHFSATMIDRFQHDLSELGFSMGMYRIMGEELAACRLPSALDQSSLSGIMSIEVFDPAYCRMLSGLNLPYLMVDGPVSIFEGSFAADQLLMDNQTHIYEFMREMKDRGKTRIGYIGEIRHCQSFYERYSAFRQSVLAFSLTDCGSITGAPKEGCSGTGYRDYLLASLRSMKQLPEVLICANDFVALDTLYALKKMHLSVPKDLWLCGFDDAPEAKLISPQLTTIHIHSQIMGQEAVSLLYSRILNPDKNFRTVYTETDLIFRA